MKFIRTSIPDVFLIEPQIICDERGFFLETYRTQEFASNGITDHFVQDNHSGSRQGILRGLHYQIRQSQGKLVRVISGKIFDVAVDLRRNSPSFAQWTGFTLSAENKYQVWIPIGFAHGFYVLSDWAEVVYRTTDYYNPKWERTLLWNDVDLGIEWPLLTDHPPILSEKDAHGSPLKQADLFD